MQESQLPDYAELHCVSNFSFLRGASHAQELVARAQALGYRALAITDECSVAGIVRAYQALKEMKEDDSGAALELIVGSEFRLDDGLRCVLLATGRESYGDLCRLITDARRAAPKGEYRLSRSDVERLRPACLALWLPAAMPDPAEARWLAGVFPQATWIAAELLQGPDDRARIARLQQLGRELALPCVACGDVHMHVRARRPLQDVLTAIRLGTTVAAAGFALFPNAERHLRHRLQLGRLYPAAWLAESVAIAARCRPFLGELRYEYPAEVVPPGETGASQLRKLAEAGLGRRFPNGASAAVRELVEKELKLIFELGYEHFFLTIHDIVEWAGSQGILCQGRGSAANSIVCYCLGITAVGPDQLTMLFERFISKERAEPPDIDVDFEHERREEVIQYIYGKYGRERTALAAAVISYRTKSALRDVGRALGMDSAQLDRLTRQLAWWDDRAKLPQRLAEAGFDPDSLIIRQLLTLVEQLRGFPRHLSQHVGGFVISQGPLSRLVPIENAAMADRTVIQWDKDDLETLGLLKVDVLALGMLTALRKALNLVNGWRGSQYTLYSVPREDEATYDMICRADTVGVFQIESRAQMSMLPRLRPRRYYDLVVEVAIVRPGPIQGGMVHPYLELREKALRGEPVGSPFPRIDPVLKRTFGVPIFQEQVMQIAITGAGFTGGEADQLRRAMASWRRTGSLALYREKLVGGLVGKGCPADFAERIFSQVQGFSDYGFPESHAASFALLAYISSWLKCHEPAAFCCALLNSLPMGFYGPSQLIQDARRHGVEVRPVDVVASEWDSTLEPAAGTQPAIRLGFGRIAGFSRESADTLLAIRGARSFADAEDFYRRAAIAREQAALLAQAGALRSLLDARRTASWVAAGLDTPLALADGRPDIDARPVALPVMTTQSQVLSDYRSLGLSLHEHPIALVRRHFQRSRRRLVTAAGLKDARNGQLVHVIGLAVTRQRPDTAKNVLFMTLEDETGPINVVIWEAVQERFRREILGGRVLLVSGELQQHDGVIHLVAKRFEDHSALWLGPVVSRDFR